jgi:chromosome segregation ATPase
VKNCIKNDIKRNKICLYIIIDMSDNICNDCGATFTRKSNLIYHMNKKFSCKTEYKKIDDKYECIYCFIIVARLDTIKNHLECCIEKVKKIKDKEIEELNLNHTTEISELKNLNEDYKNVINDHKREIQKLKLELKKSQDLIHKLSSKKSKKKTEQDKERNKTRKQTRKKEQTSQIIYSN